MCVIVGPTASGKTQLSIQIAEQYNGEIINGDAMQVYQGMDIGTAKITPDEMEGIPHHLFSFIQPSETYSIYHHQQYVREVIDDITNRGKLPIIVGGSGLYVQSVLYDYQLQHERVSIQDNPDESNETLWKRLALLDEEASEQIHQNNRKRVLRAIALAESGSKKSEIERQDANRTLLYDALVIGIEVERSVLNERIEQRVQAMLDAGLEKEVETLFATNVGQTAKVAIGYREWLPYFEQKISIEEVQQQIVIHTRQLAKKQMTWFYNQRLPILWVQFPTDIQYIQEKISDWKIK